MITHIINLVKKDIFVESITDKSEMLELDPHQDQTFVVLSNGLCMNLDPIFGNLERWYLKIIFNDYLEIHVYIHEKLSIVKNFNTMNRRRLSWETSLDDFYQQFIDLV
jgi:hypothetical protein